MPHPNQRDLRPFWMLAACVLLIWLFFLGWTWSDPSESRWNGLMAFFSGLAFAGMFCALFLQKQELSLQRKELADTRQELRQTREAAEKQAELMAQSALLSAANAQLNKPILSDSEKELLLRKIDALESRLWVSLSIGHRPRP